MLKQLLEGNIVFRDSVNGWENSIQIAAEPLLLKAKIKQQYIDDILAEVKKKGFYIVISEDVAVPHVSSQDGVNELSLSLLISKTAIEYGKYDNIRLVFVFGILNTTTHMEMLENLAIFLSDNNNLNKLLVAETEEEVLSLFEK